MWVCSPRETAGPRASLQDVLVAVPAHTPAQRQSCHRAVRVWWCQHQLSRLSWLAAILGQELKSFFGVWHTPLLLTEQRWVGASPSRRGAQGSSHTSLLPQHQRPGEAQTVPLAAAAASPALLQPGPPSSPGAPEPAATPPCHLWHDGLLHQTHMISSANRVALGIFFLPPSW